MPQRFPGPHSCSLAGTRTAQRYSNNDGPVKLMMTRTGSITSVVATLLFGSFCFHVGLIVGSEKERQNSCSLAGSGGVRSATFQGKPSSRRRGLAEDVSVFDATIIATTTNSPPRQDEPRRPEGLAGDSSNNKNQQKQQQQQRNQNAPTSTSSSSSILAGVVHVNRHDFVASIVDDIGVPLDPNPATGGKDVLILYTSQSSLPGTNFSHHEDPSLPGGVVYYPVERALENCLSLKVILSDKEFDNEGTCVALVDHHGESSHVHRFRRIPHTVVGSTTVATHDLALRHVSRSVAASGDYRGALIPSQDTTTKYWKELAAYLIGQEETLVRLDPIARAAAGSNNNAVVVMAVNFGQSELFVNFICAARSRNIDVSQHMLLFATDAATVRLAQSLGVHVFDVQDAFGSMPTEAAGTYADDTFGRIVLAKIYSVQLMLMLGYDVLLQDVDVFWRRHPLPYFTDSASTTFSTENQDNDNGGFDLIFQDDGSRDVRFAPFFANTGFYFVKNNDRTKYLFNHLVRMGDTIQQVKCDQESMAMFLNEHVSWKGLRVKVLGRDSPEGQLFPSGFHVHRRVEYMKQLMRGEVDPYVFHLSWTENKKDKVLLLQQMGEWFLQPDCVGQLGSLQDDNNHTIVAGGVALSGALCCSAQPLIQCHYRDMPSIVNCNDAANKISTREAFWPI
jgi:hypothetical protein